MASTDQVSSAPPAVPVVVRGAWLLFGGILTGVVLVAGPLLWWLILTGPVEVRTEHSETSVTEPVTALEVTGDLGDGDITVLAAPAGSSRTVIERQSRWGWQRPTRSEEVFGGVLRIHSRCQVGLGKVARDCAVSYVLRVPERVAARFTLDSGNVRIQGLAGDLTLTTHRGAIDIAETSGRVVVDATSGDVVGTGLRGGEARVNSIAGDISLAFALSPNLVSVTSEWGDVDVCVPVGPDANADSRRPGYQVYATTDSGEEHIGVVEQEDATRTIIADLSRGDLTLLYGR